MKSEPLSKVAPARSSDRHVAADTVVWHLNLDQIVSGIGAIANRVHAPLRDAGTSTFVFDERNVLYSKLRPYLNKVVCPDSIGVATTELVPLRPDPQKLDRNYLCYYLRSPAFVSWVSSQVAGAKMPRVSMKSFWSHEIPLPPLEDQIRIAYLLSKIEGLIAQRKQHLQKLDELLKSVFQDTFGDPVANEKGWDTIPFSELLTGIESGSSPKCEPRQATTDEWGVLKLGSVTSCYYKENENKALPPDVEPDKTIEVKAGDVLFSRKNTYELVAASAYIFRTRERLLLPDLIFRLAIKPNAPLNPIYLWRLLLCTSQRLKIQSLASGAAGSMPNISKANLIRVRIPCPPPSLQEHFAKIVLQIQKLKELIESKTNSFETLRNVISQQAFNGELDLSRVILPDGPNTLDLGDTPYPMTEPTDQEPFELPTPLAPSLEDAYQARELAITQWLNAYSIHLRSRPFSADDFLNLVQQKLSSMEEELDAEWVSEPVSAKDYEQVKVWIFENMQSQRFQQTYDDNNNRVRVSQGKD